MRILIAEDDPFSLNILTQMIESTHRYTVVPARNGAEAWAELERGAGFDLCILDIMMPEMDGLTLVRRMRADPRFQHQRVMVCTALNERSIIGQAAALGVAHYIVKPFFREHVLKQVQRICEEAPAAQHFEPLVQVAERLGLGEAALTGFLGDLHRDVAALIRDFKAATGATAGVAVMRVNSLKGAAINLGARTLASQLAALEDCCSGRAKNSINPVILSLETENQRLHHRLGSGVTPVPVAAV